MEMAVIGDGDVVDRNGKKKKLVATETILGSVHHNTTRQRREIIASSLKAPIRRS